MDQSKNLSFILEEPHKVRLGERPSPQIRFPFDVLVNTRYTGICGSDVSHLSTLPRRAEKPMYF